MSINLEDILLERNEDSMQTLGLTRYQLPEVRIEAPHDTPMKSVKSLIQVIVGHDYGQLASHEEKCFPFGYWPIKIKKIGELVEIWEADAELSSFHRGAKLALLFWDTQHETCKQLGAEFCPPMPEQLVAVSEGVLENELPIQGVRYPSPPHMSGWWITTDRYNNDIRNLKTMHLHHITASVEDIGRLVALPPGYRFRISKDHLNVWYDLNVANSPQ